MPFILSLTGDLQTFSFSLDASAMNIVPFLKWWMLPAHRIPTIYLCDRGYASYNSFAHVIENGQFFLIRCTDKRQQGCSALPLMV